MLKDSGSERAKLFAEHLNETFTGSQTTWSGPPEQPARGANKRIVVDERIFDLWGGSKPGLQKTLQHYKLDDHISKCVPGSELHIKPGSGEKPEFETKL